MKKATHDSHTPQVRNEAIEMEKDEDAQKQIDTDTVWNVGSDRVRANRARC